MRTYDDLDAFETISLVIDEIDCGAMKRTAMQDGSTMLSLILASGMIGVAGQKTCQLIMSGTDGIIQKSSQFSAYVGAANDIDQSAVDGATLIIINEAITQMIQNYMPSCTDEHNDGNIVISFGE